MQQTDVIKMTSGLLLVCSSLLTGCEQRSSSPEPASEAASQAPNPSSSKHPEATYLIKVFPVTANDKHDIQQLEDFSSRLASVRQDMSNELHQLEKEGSLTTEFQQERLHDLTQSAQHMLAALELKTEQGRYIQGLYAQYWENRANGIQDQNVNQSPTAQAANADEEQLAQAQLQHWKTQQPHQP